MLVLTVFYINLLSRQYLKLYFYHNLFSMYFKFESEFNGEKQKSKTGAHFWSAKRYKYG